MCVIVRDAMSTVAKQTKFVARVRAEMASQNLSVRGLARKMDPANVDRARRNLHRWLDEGIAPGRASRQEVATALGVDAHELADDDDEESDQMTLDQFLESRVRKLLEKIQREDGHLVFPWRRSRLHPAIWTWVA